MATSAYATASFIPIPEDNCRACRDVFCDSCSGYRLLCRDLHDKNSIVRVRVCRACFSKNRNDRARTPKRKTATANSANTPTALPDKHSNQPITTATISTATTARRTKPATPTAAAARTDTKAQTVTVSTLPPAVPAPKRNTLLDRQIAQLSDDDGGGKKAVLDILKKEVEKDDREDRTEVEEEEEEDEEEEEEEGEGGEEGEEGEEEEEEGEQGGEGTAVNAVSEEGVEVEEEEEVEVEEEGEEEQEILSIPADSLASVKHSVGPAAPTPRAQQRPTAASPRQTVTASTSTVAISTPRSTGVNNKETVQVMTADKETQRVYSTFEGKGEERLTETTDGAMAATPRSTKQVGQQTAQQVVPIVKSSEYSKKPPTPKQPAPSSPSLRQQLSPLNTQVQTPRSAAKTATIARTSITPQAAKVFAALARSATPTSAASAISSIVVEQPTAHSLSGSVIVPSWPPVASEHLLAVRGQVVEASTVRPASPLMTSAEEEVSAAAEPTRFSLSEQSAAGLLAATSPTATGRVAAPPPAFAASNTTATTTIHRSTQQPHEQSIPASQTTHTQHRPANISVQTQTTHQPAHNQQPTTQQPTTQTRPLHQPTVRQPPTPPASPYLLLLQPIPIAIAVLLFIVLCAVLPLLYSIPATLLLATSVPMLYSWLWEKRRVAEEEPAFVVNRDFPQLEQLHNQLVEQQQREQFERNETRRLSSVLPSPKLAKDYASQCVVTDETEEEDYRQRYMAPEKAKLVV